MSFFTLKAWNAQKAGAAAVLVVDNRPEPLITMDMPEEENTHADYVQDITIPSALISMSLGNSIKKALNKGNTVNIKLDWTEALPHPDERVEYEFWTNSNDECGTKCDSQINFVKDFKGAAQILERKGYTQFTPHYITWYCPEVFTFSKQCKSQCINHGSYCAPDPEQDFSKGYDGKTTRCGHPKGAFPAQLALQNATWALNTAPSPSLIGRCPFPRRDGNGRCPLKIWWVMLRRWRRWKGVHHPSLFAK